MNINIESINFFLALVAVVGVIFTVYNSYRKPQIATDLRTSDLRNDIVNLKSEIKEIKETHLRSLESEIKSLNLGVQELSKTVVKLATIIDERIPRSTAN